MKGFLISFHSKCSACFYREANKAIPLVMSVPFLQSMLLLSCSIPLPTIHHGSHKDTAVYLWLVQKRRPNTCFLSVKLKFFHLHVCYQLKDHLRQDCPLLSRWDWHTRHKIGPLSCILAVLSCLSNSSRQGIVLLLLVLMVVLVNSPYCP